MKVAISNLAWDKEEDSKILPILKKYNIHAIEIAPTKIWSDPTAELGPSIRGYKKFWKNHGISIVATTSLLYGREDLQIFGEKEIRKKTLDYLTHMINVSSLLGAKTMVFGSPKNRVTHGCPKEEALQIAIDFFSRLGAMCQRYNTFFGIEPNPAYYGTDFINTTYEAIDFVKKLNHPYVKINLDSGAMIMNNENSPKTILDALPFSCHFHISEPKLAPIDSSGVHHKIIAKTLKQHNWDNWVSIEMPLAPNVSHNPIIEKALAFVTSVYG